MPSQEAGAPLAVDGGPEGRARRTAPEAESVLSCHTDQRRGVCVRRFNSRPWRLPLVRWHFWPSGRGSVRKHRPHPRPSLMRLTSDVGWTDNPAISLDGRLLAYASDRSTERNLDIWVQQIPDGTPVRLTRNGADNVDPSFSADGSRVAFQSNRPGGGIYVVPTLGGEERLIAAGGFSPRFSPDGAWIAYGLRDAVGGGIHVAPAAGGPATRIAEEFYAARGHVWSPDGTHLLFWGQRNRDGPPKGNVDWYVAAVTGGSPVPTGARTCCFARALRRFRGCRCLKPGSGPATASCFTVTSATPGTCGKWRSPRRPGRFARAPSA